MAEEAGARMTSGWEGCHSTAWDANAADDAGERILTNQYTKSGYPLGVMINANGERFVDEGEDFRNFTYAKFGRAILMQSGGYAFQVWDSKVLSHLRKEEYADDVVEKITGESLQELAESLADKGLHNTEQFLKTLASFNTGVRRFKEDHPHSRWDPSIKDGLSTQTADYSLSIPKSNWALSIDQGPFVAVKVCCGITFTFGGVAIDPDTAGVISRTTDLPIPGLFSTGEMVGGLFYNNYPGGSGLTAGAVFGRKAGRAAAARLRQ
jgi:succinate dehydrogenase/fumarate reductase flavoprotein subunit